MLALGWIGVRQRIGAALGFNISASQHGRAAAKGSTPALIWNNQTLRSTVDGNGVQVYQGFEVARVRAVSVSAIDRVAESRSVRF